MKSLLPSLANPELKHGFHFVHRLDYSTSGVLLLALNKTAAAVASKVFSTRKTNKYYVAFVRGHTSYELIDITIPVGGSFDLRT